MTILNTMTNLIKRLDFSMAMKIVNHTKNSFII